MLAYSCFGAPPDVAVYPGSAVDEAVSKSVRKTNPENIGYNPTDAFEKVGAKAGGEDVPHSRNIGETMKFVMLRFPGKKYQVQLSWVAADKKHGTVIQLFSKALSTYLAEVVLAGGKSQSHVVRDPGPGAVAQFRFQVGTNLL
jgi:hypothetical protein